MYSQTRMYADDTSLTFAIADVKHINDSLNYDLSNVYTWLSANKLTLNSTKTELMAIVSRQKLPQFLESPSLIINDKAVEQVASAKFLRVYIDQTLNWECHIEYVCKKIASAISAIKRIRRYIPFDIPIKVNNTACSSSL